MTKHIVLFLLLARRCQLRDCILEPVLVGQNLSTVAAGSILIVSIGSFGQVRGTLAADVNKLPRCTRTVASSYRLRRLRPAEQACQRVAAPPRISSSVEPTDVEQARLLIGFGQWEAANAGDM
jgi:hypothetical protein